VTKTLKPPTTGDYAEAAALREALRSFQRTSDEVTATHGMTSRMYQLLLMIKTGREANERTGLSELEERLKLGKSTITELVLRSEERGLVRRELDQKRRGAISIRLTPDGEQRLARALAELGDERRRLIKVLSKLAAR
jgi:DNA-binding MarR family transcriptional regulator